jgi:hypothetical protein
MLLLVDAGGGGAGAGAGAPITDLAEIPLSTTAIRISIKY